MLKIDVFNECPLGADYLLEDGTLLFDCDWNGEIYGNGFKNGNDTNLRYRPVYNQVAEDDFEIIGFEEI